MATAVQGKKFNLGRGKCLFNRKRTDGTYVGYRFVGNTPRVVITPSQEVVTARSAADKVSAVVAEDILSQDYEIEMDANEFIKANLALAFFGEEALYTQAATAITDESINAGTAVTGGHYYYTAKREHASIQAVTGPAGTPVYTSPADYTSDAEDKRLGRIFVVAGGAMDGDVGVIIDYTPTAITNRPFIKAGEATDIEGELEFVSENIRGDNNDFRFWRVKIRSDQAVSLISNEYGAITLKVRVLGDPERHPTNQYFEIFELTAA